MVDGCVSTSVGGWLAAACQPARLLYILSKSQADCRTLASRPAGTSCCASCRASCPSSTPPLACRQAVLTRSWLEDWGVFAAGAPCTCPPVLTVLPQSHPLHPLQPNMTGPEQADAEAPTQANTGLRQLSHVWQMELWRNISEVTSWAPPHLEHVRGSDGVQFRWGWGLSVEGSECKCGRHGMQ